MASIIDSLLSLGSGAARGFRISEERSRQLMEAKRRALLEERQQALQERRGLAEIDYQDALRQKVQGETERETRAFGESQEPFALGDTTGRAPYLNRLVRNRGDVSRYAPLLERIMQEEGAKERTGLEETGRNRRYSLMSNRTGRGRTPKTADERLGGYLEKIIGLQPSGDIEAARPEQFAKRQRAALDLFLEFDPEVKKYIEELKSGKSKRDLFNEDLDTDENLDSEE